MKLLKNLSPFIAGILLLSTTTQADSDLPAFARPCAVKIENAAIYALAQELAMPISGVEVTEQLGSTATSPGRTQTNFLTVRSPNRTNRALTIAVYAIQFVSADEDSYNCQIIDTKKVPARE